MRKTAIAMLVAAVFVPAARANPAGAQVVNGAALLSNPTASIMQIVSTPGTIINWQSFSIANGETARFVQLNAASAVLNRVTGLTSSDIAGRLESNGRVFLINPNGVVFGAGSVVDVAGLVASTRNISDANFLAGNYLFTGAGSGTITLQSGARIVTSSYGLGGQVWLFAKNVTQESGSSITAPGGQVVLAAGSEIQVATNGLGQMSFAVTTDGTNTVDSLGSIAADRGAVGLFADFVNHRGAINAGTQGSVSMNAAKELRIKDGSLVDAPDGSITLRGGSLLEVEHDATLNADGAKGVISFESNNLLVFPDGNAHAVGGKINYTQYQPSQYAAGTQLALVTRPVNVVDEAVMVYRRSDGNYVMRFARTLTGAPVFAFEPGSGYLVEGYFEVVFDGRTGAVVSGPAAINLGSTEAAGINAARAALNNVIAARVALGAQYKIDEDTYYATQRAYALANSNGQYTAAIEALNAAFRATYDAYLANQLSSDLAQNAARNAVSASYAPFNALATSGPSRFQPFTFEGGSSAMTDGSRITYAFASYDVRSVADAVLQTAPLPGAFGYLPAAIVPRQNGGFSVVSGGSSNSFGTFSLWTFDKDASASTASNQLTGTAGVSSALAMRPGLSNGTDVTASPAPSPVPSPAPPPVVNGTGTARFDGVAGCNSAVCDHEVRNAVAVNDAVLAAQPAAGATLGLDTSRAEAQVNALQRAAGLQPNAAFSNVVAVLMVDNGELRRLVQGDRFDKLSKPERLAKINQWLEKETLEQGAGESTTEVSRITPLTPVLLMNDEERIAYGAEIARMQLNGVQPPDPEPDSLPPDPTGPALTPEQQIDFDADEQSRLRREAFRDINAPAGGRP